MRCAVFDDVDGAPLELGQTKLEAEPIELLPRDAWFEARVLLADPPVPGDQLETELREIPGFDLADAIRDKVIMKESHRTRAILDSALS